jgi:hypothetical protein
MEQKGFFSTPIFNSDRMINSGLNITLKRKNMFNNNHKKTENQKKNQPYVLKDSIKTINKHLSGLSVSLSGEFTFKNTNGYSRRFNNSDLELF